MKKSKILSFVIALAMAVSCFAGATSVGAAPMEYDRSDEGTYFYFGEESQLEAKPGEDFTIYLGIADMPSICTLYVDIDWEPTPAHGGPALPVPKPVKNTGLFVNGDGTTIVPVMSGYVVPVNPFRICYDDSANYNGEWTQNGIFATATFTMPEDAIVGTEYEIVISADPAEVYNLALHEYVVDEAIAHVKVIEDVPATEAPATEAPATEAPATEAPATEAPATEAPATEAPATEAPATEAPATEAPATEAPATEAPATEAPATEAPATEAPATDAPVDGDNANTGDSFSVFATIAIAITLLGAVVIIRRKRA